MQKAQRVKIQGFIRFQLVDLKTGRIKTSKWHKNAVTVDGFQNYIVGTIGAIAASKQISYLQVATQTTAPSSSQTSASGEFEARKTTSNSFITNGTLQMTASFNTNEATQSTLGGVALYNTSSGGVAAAVGTFATTNKTTDQVFNVTYQWRFS